MIEIRFEPLTDFTVFSSEPERAPFRASWTTTLKNIDGELRHLDADNVVLEAAVTAGQIRRDGWLRADARPTHHGVRLSFDSSHGRLSYVAGSYDDWQANVRAIALTLNALRAVDRWGATAGEQYTGFKAITANVAMTRARAAEVLSAWSGVKIDADESEQSVRARWRDARIAAHPDLNGGDHSFWHEVEEAARVLGATS